MTTRIDALDTPFAAIDLDIVERNLARAQRYFDEHKLALRPHVKTHKIPELARRQVELGARGITCQKIGEAEVMADAGIADILLTFNIVGPLKLRRLVDLARRVRLSVVADSREVAAGLSEMYRAHEIDLSTEHRPGTYIYSDRYMAAHGVGTLADCALRIVATVVSRPTADRAIIDAGSKSFSSDPMGLAGHGAILEHPEAALAQLSEEHGHLDLSRCRDKPRVGDRLTIIPNHACAVSNLHDRVHGVTGDRLERTFEVKARGRVQ